MDTILLHNLLHADASPCLRLVILSYLFSHLRVCIYVRNESYMEHSLNTMHEPSDGLSHSI